MKHINIFKLYSLIFFTSGLYCFLWLYEIADRSNGYFSKRLFIRKQWVYMLFLVFILTLIFTVYFDKQPGFGMAESHITKLLGIILLISSALFLISLLFNLVQVNNYLRDGLGINAPSNIGVVILFFILFLSPILMQHKINKSLKEKEY